jgi:hypothetical protein
LDVFQSRLYSLKSRKVVIMQTRCPSQLCHSAQRLS